MTERNLPTTIHEGDTGRLADTGLLDQFHNDWNRGDREYQPKDFAPNTQDGNSDFIRGFTFGTNLQDANMAGAYATTAADAAMDALIATGVTHPLISVFNYFSGQTPSTVDVDASFTATDSAITHIVQRAQALGAAPCLRLNVRCHDGTDRAAIMPSSVAAFWASFQARIVHLATLSETLQCPLFVIAAEQLSLQKLGRGIVTSSGSSVNVVGVSTGWTAADVGKTFVMYGAGMDGAPFVTTIATYTDATHISLAAAPTLNVVGFAKWSWAARWTSGTVTTAVGSAAIVGTSTSWTRADIGQTIVIPAAGTGGVPMYSAITDVTDSTHATIRDLAAVAVTKNAAWGRMDQYWRDIIAACRAVYSGSLSYADAQWSTSYLNQVSFWDALDYIGVNMYDFPRTVANLPEAELVSGWDVSGIVDKFTRLYNRWQKPILLTECGAVNADSAGTANLVAGPVNNPQQAVYYEALFQLVRKLGFIRGMFPWWWTSDGASPYFTSDWIPQAPAIATIKKWYAPGNRINEPSTRLTGTPLGCHVLAQNVTLNSSFTTATGDQTIAMYNSAGVSPVFDNDNLTENYFASTANLIVNTPGTYEITGHVVFAGNTHGTFRRGAIVRQLGGWASAAGANGAQSYLDEQSSGPPSTTALNVSIHLSATVRLERGDLVRIVGTHDAWTPTATQPSTTTTVSTSVFNKTSHGNANGTKMALPALLTTNGFAPNTAYYVVNTATNTYQLAATAGGAAITMGGTDEAAFTAMVAADETTVAYGATQFASNPERGSSLSLTRIGD